MSRGDHSKVGISGMQSSASLKSERLVAGSSAQNMDLSRVASGVSLLDGGDVVIVKNDEVKGVVGLMEASAGLKRECLIVAGSRKDVNFGAVAASVALLDAHQVAASGQTKAESVISGVETSAGLKGKGLVIARSAQDVHFSLAGTSVGLLDAKHITISGNQKLKGVIGLVQSSASLQRKVLVVAAVIQDVDLSFSGARILFLNRKHIAVGGRAEVKSVIGGV